MSEPDENSTFPHKSKFLMEQKETRTPSTLMDLDLVDLDASWPFDQFPISPFLFSSAPADLPCSPLWTFQNDYVETPRFLSLNADPVSETAKENDDRKRSLPTHIGLSPMESNGSYIKERMTQALRYFKESTEQHVLAQVWAPVKNGGRFVLTTSGQPYVLDPRCNGLNEYRMISLTYMFSVDGKSDGEELGLPGRVFNRKLPEWTPNVQYYSSREFSRRDHALHYNVRGTLALPVFEPSGQTCVGVVELILTSEKINYATEVDQVCKALEAVNLKSSEILDHPNTQICNIGRHNALAEISEILTMICEMHKLPLAQTWVPCRHRSVLAYGGGLKKSCSSFDGSCMGKVCMSTSDVAFYIVDAHIWGFRDACAEHHLQLGQGVAGKAFSSHNSFFCSDITKFSKTEYPLVHYARLFGLTSCFAICLRSTYTGNDDYILEFFLPPSIKDCRDQQTLLDTLLTMMKQHFKSLKIVSRKELDDEKSIEIIKASMDDDNQLESKLDSIKISPSLMIGTGALNDRRIGTKNGASFSENKQGMKKTLKKRGKAEKSISLEVLQQYFAGSLKDAAKSLGVCPTTMKRICRQHGISRWPSRKINKVNRSLSKLKLVIESVQGGDQSFALNSLSTSPLAVGSISWHTGNGSNHQAESPEFKPFTPRREKIASPTCNTPESDGHAEKSGFISESVNVTKNIKKRNGSGEESAGSPTSHGSCQDTPTNEITVAKDSYNLSGRDHCLTKRGSMEGENQSTEKLDLLAEESFGAILVEDAGSSKDLRNLCPSAADAIVEEQVPEIHWTNPPFPDSAPKQPTPTMAWETRNYTVKQEMTTVTIKATYREDIIRFKIALSCSIVELREEVAKRLKLEVGTFDIKYLDDDHEWVLIACNADFKECMDISRSSGSNMIRLSIHDLMSNFGSSCESTGGGF